MTESKYTPLAELGRGGMATAYLAAVQGPGGFNKLVVIKRLRPALAAEPDFLRMFLEEARLSARIDHPNVVHTTEVGFDGEHHYIAMEYLDGQSHEALLRRLAKVKSADASPDSGLTTAVAGEEHLPLKLHLFVISQMLNGLDFAHELKDFDGNPLNVVHRDVSPHNVMVTYEGHVKVLDFGIAKAADSSGDTRTGMMKGKCAYMPAEQFGGKGLDRRADIFAVGVILWQALAGRKLWKGLSDAEIFQRVATGDIPKPSTLKSSVAPELDAICMKALALRPDDRFATAAEFQTAIDDYVAGQPELRTNARELGKFLSELFRADREKLKTIIEEQLGAGGKVSQRNLSIPVFTTKTTGSSVDSSMIAASTNPAAADDAATPKRSRRVVVFAAIACAAVAIPATILGMRATSHPAAASPSKNETTTSVTVRATPAQAKIFFDDGVLEGNPATSSFRRDAVKHRVRVEAPGFTPKSEWVTFDAPTMTIELILDPEPTASPKNSGSNSGTDAKKPPTAPTPPTWQPPRVAPPSVPAVTAPVVAQPPGPLPTNTPSTPVTVARPTGPDLDKSDPWANKSKR